MRMTMAAIFAIVMGSAASAQTAPTGSWGSESSFNFIYFFGGSATDGTSLYLLGGWGLSTGAWKYDPATGAWTRLPNMPHNQRGNAAAWCNGAIYSFGMDVTGVGAIMKYDIPGNAWSTLSTRTAHGLSLGASAIGSKIYLTGGYFSGGTNLCSEFDAATGTVRARTPMPSSVSYHASAAVGDKVYVFGGLGPVSTVFEYDTTRDRWTSRGSIQRDGAAFPLNWPRALVLMDRIFLVGGIGAAGAGNSATLEYSPFRNIWRRRADAPVIRHGHGGAVIGGRAYVYGGRGIQTIDEFTPPDLGLPPRVAQGLVQIGSTGVTPRDGWTNRMMTFSGTFSDPDAGQRVRLEVQIKAAASPSWDDAAVVDSGFRPQGRIDVEHTLPAEGTYDWRYRVSDENDLFTPMSGGMPGWIDFDAASPDFHSDHVAPVAVLGHSPEGELRVPDRLSFPIELRWSESADDGPSFTYEVQVALNDPEFGASVVSSTGLTSTNASFRLAVSRYDYSWRARAVDGTGNATAWSVAKNFRVLFEDGINHSEGDAAKVCGFSAPAGPSAAILLLLLAIAVVGRGRRAQRSAQRTW